MALWKRVLCGFALAAIVTVPLYAKVVAKGTRTGNQTFQGGNFALQLTKAAARTRLVHVARASTPSASARSAKLQATGSRSRSFWTSSTLRRRRDQRCVLQRSQRQRLPGRVDDGTLSRRHPEPAAGVHTVQVLGSVVGGLNGGGLATGWIGDSVCHRGEVGQSEKEVTGGGSPPPPASRPSLSRAGDHVPARAVRSWRSCQPPANR